nr:adenylate/guanylate cyclase domain-containing protein [Spirochaeta isovalerica]
MTGEKRKIVVLFSHIRNFEYIAEHNSAENIVRFLNQHFTSMGSIIKDNGGTIDKFIGDAIFAIFGAPISYTDNCGRAARAAKEMIETYRKNNTSFMTLPSEGFHIGVGLNEGVAIIGNIGCSVKFDYTAIGDTVNLAARLESLCKHYHRHILISEVMYHQLKNDYFCRLVDVARVKGKTEPSRIYSLEIEPDLYPEKWRELYQKGLSMYLMGNWYLAIQYLEEALEILPEDFPTSQFLDRCEEYRSDPPDRWDGAVTLNFK